MKRGGYGIRHRYASSLSSENTKGDPSFGWTAFRMLPGRDSNPRQGGYSTPYVSIRSGLSHRPRLNVRASGANGAYRLRYSSPSLCTFLVTFCASPDFAQDSPSSFSGREGFPEFTRFFNPPFGGKLHIRGYSHLLYQLSYPGIAVHNGKGPGRCKEFGLP